MNIDQISGGMGCFQAFKIWGYFFTRRGESIGLYKDKKIFCITEKVSREKNEPTKG